MGSGGSVPDASRLQHVGQCHAATRLPRACFSFFESEFLSRGAYEEVQRGGHVCYVICLGVYGMFFGNGVSRFRAALECSVR